MFAYFCNNMHIQNMNTEEQADPSPELDYESYLREISTGDSNVRINSKYSFRKHKWENYHSFGCSV